MEKIIINDFELENYSIEDTQKLINECNIYGFIYITKNLINSKLYLGQKAISKKWKTYYGSGNLIKRAIKKYGKENFIRYIINFACSEEELNYLEFVYTKIFDCVRDDNWYNLIYGGGFSGIRGVPFSEEHKMKLSEAKKGKNNPNYGKQYTKEERKLLRDKLSGENNPMFGKKGELSPCFGKKHSEETKKKMSDAAIGNKNHNYGISWSDEHRYKYKKYILENGAMGAKETYCYDLDGNFIKSYINATEAAKDINGNHSNISKICRQKRGKHHGYQWRYAEDVNYLKENIGKYKRN